MLQGGSLKWIRPRLPLSVIPNKKGDITMKKRNTFTYDFKVGQKIVHSGITKDLEEREKAHQQRWPKGHIVKVGAAKTEEAALAWEKTKHKAITPRRKK
jgi:predicted GIY-YIG superfamily endonuclease